MGIQWWYLVKYVTCGCIWNGAHRQTGYQYFSKENYRWNWGYAISKQTHIYGLYSGYWPLPMPGPVSPSSSLPSQSLTKGAKSLREPILYTVPVYTCSGTEYGIISETSKEIYTNTIGFVPYFDIVLYIYVHRDDYILCIYHWYTDCFPKPDTYIYIYICNMYIYIYLL